MEIKTGIYKITNKITNKCYVGQSIDIYRRWQEHCRPSSNSIIGKAIRKYGKENFDFEILEEVKNIKDLNEKEAFYISFLIVLYQMVTTLLKNL